MIRCKFEAGENALTSEKVWRQQSQPHLTSGESPCNAVDHSLRGED